MSKIPTAEDIVNKYALDDGDIQAMKEFAKLHVEAALQAALEKSKLKGEWETIVGNPKILGSYQQVFKGYVIIPESILDAYPKENIK